MKKLLNHFRQYIYDTLGVTVSPPERMRPGSLPFFLHDTYIFYRTAMMGLNVVLIIPKSSGDISPSVIQKHSAMTAETLSEEVVLVCPSISSYARKRLIEHKVQFVIPGNQMYLPNLKIDMREHFIAIKPKAAILSPSAQAVILYSLYNPLAMPATPSYLAEKLGYSKMTMTRSLDEIESANLGKISRQGRQRILQFEMTPLQLWEKALPCLKSPVTKNVWLTSLPKDLAVIQAGQSALSHYSMLAPPHINEYAIGKEDWKAFKKNHSVEELKYPEDAGIKLEIWSYPPKLFAQDDITDKLSVYLSLKTVKDERVESALERMINKMEWQGIE
ncbi:MAG: hypothetical protein K9M57_01545 [Phycisphaerae bacterium]|nr:hypothetical protein [Phycisphaerae bacterium]